jgi:crotonobetainyl-CoA:carnitine CoA-transferase CaiB-like acyl-CoA transferase
MDLTGEPDSPPQKVGAPAADLLAGMDAAYAIMGALFDHERTGRGHKIDVSLTESMTRFLTPHLMSYLGSGDVPRRSGGRDSVIAIYQTFETEDFPITLGLGNDRIFRRFCEAVQRPTWATDPRYATNVLRRTHREELVAMIQEVLGTQSRAVWLGRFVDSGIPAGPINTLADVVEDGALIDRGLLFNVTIGDDRMPQVGTGWHLDGSPNGRVVPPPEHGANTEDVLRNWARVDSEELIRLREMGIISEPFDRTRVNQ